MGFNKGYVIMFFGLIMVFLSVMLSAAEARNVVSLQAQTLSNLTDLRLLLSNPTQWLGSMITLFTLQPDNALAGSRLMNAMYLLLKLATAGFWFEVGTVILPLIGNVLGKALNGLTAFLSFGTR